MRKHFSCQPAGCGDPAFHSKAGIKTCTGVYSVNLEFPIAQPRPPSSTIDHADTPRASPNNPLHSAPCASFVLVQRFDSRNAFAVGSTKLPAFTRVMTAPVRVFPHPAGGPLAMLRLWQLGQTLRDILIIAAPLYQPIPTICSLSIHNSICWVT